MMDVQAWPGFVRLDGSAWTVRGPDGPAQVEAASVYLPVSRIRQVLQYPGGCALETDCAGGPFFTQDAEEAHRVVLRLVGVHIFLAEPWGDDD